MSDTEKLRRLLDELRKLACDINEEEIRSHSVITLNQGQYNRQFRLDMNHDWLNAWHTELERILQAIAATLGSFTERAVKDSEKDSEKDSDGRGVPWRCYGYENHTWWGEWHAENRPSVNGLFIKVEGVVTPEQAIAATLGRGECQQEDGGWSTEGDHARVWLTCGHDCMVETVADLPNFCPVCGAKVVDR